MIKKFSLNPGEQKTIFAFEAKHIISWNQYENHDHQNKPLYLEPENPNHDTFVACVESTPAGRYNSPYASTIEGSWIVMRENLSIKFERQNTAVKITIFKEKDREQTLKKQNPELFSFIKKIQSGETDLDKLVDSDSKE